MTAAQAGPTAGELIPYDPTGTAGFGWHSFRGYRTSVLTEGGRGERPLRHTRESENRMGLDRVPSNTGLAMLEVEEGDPGNTSASADANGLSSPGHLPPAIELRRSSKYQAGASTWLALKGQWIGPPVRGIAATAARRL
jgi:hypothetical protein